MNRVLIFTFIIYLLLRSIGIRYIHFGPISEVIPTIFSLLETQSSCHDAVPQERSYIRNEYAILTNPIYLI